MQTVALVALAAVAVGAATTAAAARSAHEPIRLVWTEGDVAGTTTIYSGDDGRRGQPIGVVEYRQRRNGDLLTATRVARFQDGSSDEDTAVARVDRTLVAVSGRSLIRDTDGEPLVDLRIDVAGGRIEADYGRGEDRKQVSQKADLPPATYWGPLIFIVLKNFAANAEDGKLSFRTVAPIPGPYVFDLELKQGTESAALERTNIRLAAQAFTMVPSVHWAVDPLVRWLAPAARFWALPGEPPALVRFAGPRNYRRQMIMIE